MLRLALLALLLAMVVVSPVSAFVWLGPFPPPIGNSTPPPTNETVPPIFGWTEPPGTGGTVDQNPPGGIVETQGTPEPSTIVAGLIGAGTLGAIRWWRKRNGK